MCTSVVEGVSSTVPTPSTKYDPHSRQQRRSERRRGYVEDVDAPFRGTQGITLRGRQRGRGRSHRKKCAGEWRVDLVGAVLLGGDRWRRFNRRSYDVLPYRPPDTRALGKLSLTHGISHDAAAFAQDFLAAETVVHLRCARLRGVVLSQRPQMPEVSLACRSRAVAVTGRNLTRMFSAQSRVQGVRDLFHRRRSDSFRCRFS